MQKHAPSTERAIRAACCTAEDLGLSFDRAVVLRNRSNLLIHLQPAPVVARIATNTAIVRHGSEWLAREVAVAQHLVANGAPVAPPSCRVSPGPHVHDGFTLSFWEYVEVSDQPLDPTRAGSALHVCHAALDDFNGPLPHLATLEEAERIVALLDDAGALAQTDIELLRQVSRRVRQQLHDLSLPARPRRGDAHLGNVLNTAGGPLWSDWEDTFAGPLGWDLACLVAHSRITNEGSDQAAAALRGYGAAIDPAVLALLVEARALQVVVWSALFAHHDPTRVSALQSWLSWLRTDAAAGRAS
jgi:phosphotransferase family enzyme